MQACVVARMHTRATVVNSAMYAVCAAINGYSVILYIRHPYDFFGKLHQLRRQNFQCYFQLNEVFSYAPQVQKRKPVGLSNFSNCKQLVQRNMDCIIWNRQIQGIIHEQL